MNMRTLMLLDLKAYKVGRGAFRRLQRRARNNPRLAQAMASGRIEATTARGRRLTSAQRARRELRDGISKQPRNATLYDLRAKPDGATVGATLASRNGHVTTSWGARLRHRRGKDMITTYGPGDQGVVRGDIFKDTYVPAGAGTYVRCSRIKLLPVTTLPSA